MFEPRLALRRKAYISLGYRMMSMYNICYSLCGLLRFGDNQALPPGQARHQRRRSRLSPKRLYKRPLFCRGRSPLAIAAAIGQNTAFCLVAQGRGPVPPSAGPRFRARQATQWAALKPPAKERDAHKARSASISKRESLTAFPTGSILPRKSRTRTPRTPG